MGQQKMRKQCTKCNSIRVRFRKRTEDWYCDNCKGTCEIRELVGVYGVVR
jgi:ribosomal protein L37AE/L43A